MICNKGEGEIPKRRQCSSEIPLGGKFARISFPGGGGGYCGGMDFLGHRFKMCEERTDGCTIIEGFFDRLEPAISVILIIIRSYLQTIVQKSNS